MKHSLRAKMILFIGLPALAVFLALLIWLLGFAEQQALMTRQAEMAEEAAAVAEQFDEYIGRAAQVADITARFTRLVPDLRDENVYGILRGNVGLNPRIYGAAMAFEPGTYKEGDRLFSPYVYESKGGGELVEMDINESVYDWYRDEQWQWWHLPKRLGKGVWTAPYFDKGAGNVLMVTYAVPFERKGAFGGVTTVDIDLERLGEDVRNAIPGIGEFTILGADGSFIFSTDQEKILTQSIFDVLEKGGVSEEEKAAAEEILGGDAGEVTLDHFLTDGTTIYTHAPIPSTGWTFVSSHSEAVAMEEFRKRRAKFIGGFTGAGLLMLLTIVYMSGRVAKPIRSLQRQVLRVADGEGEIEASGFREGDEIGDLARAFADLQEKVRDRETRLETSRETTLKELLESAPDAMLVVDREGRVSRINSKVEELFGVDRQSAVGRSVHDFLRGGEAAKKAGSMASLLREPERIGKAKGMELEGVKEEGGVFPVEIGMAPFHEPEGLVSVIVIRDITEREQAQRQIEAANQAKSEFLAHMSHEIRTPLNAIIGFSQLLARDESLGEEHRRTVGTIERSGNHLLTLINDILEMSKIEAGQLTMNRESVSLLAIAEDMREMMGLKARQKGLRFEMEWDDDLPEFADIDSGKFRQIVLNLLSNAVKFTDSGSVRLLFSSVDDPDISPRRSLRVEVVDCGPGISREDQAKLFAAFYQSDTGRRQQGGTGLGLAISARFAEFLGGKLSLESEPGKGSTFVLRLPVDPSGNLEAKAAQSRSSRLDGVVGLDLEGGEKPPKILVAEDQPANRELMDRLLGDVGFEVRFAETGTEAIERVADWEPDFVWMDLQMPEMDGDEATRRIREIHGDSLPIVALTASVLTIDRDGLREAGFDDVFMKPVRPGELFEAMAERLGIRYLTKEGADEASEDAVDESAFSGLARLSDSLKTQLRECIDLGDLGGIEACVADIRAVEPEVADSLTEPLANFAFESIVKAMDEETGNH